MVPGPFTGGNFDLVPPAALEMADEAHLPVSLSDPG